MPWNYTDKLPGFNNLLDQIQASGIKLFSDDLELIEPFRYLAHHPDAPKTSARP